MPFYPKCRCRKYCGQDKSEDDIDDDDIAEDEKEDDTTEKGEEGEVEVEETDEQEDTQFEMRVWNNFKFWIVLAWLLNISCRSRKWNEYCNLFIKRYEKCY